MAHTVELNDGTDTLNLAVSTSTGIRLISLELPRSARIERRTEPVAGIYGRRTIDSALDDVEVVFVGRLVSGSEDGVAILLRQLTRMLNLVHGREETGSGPIVTLSVKRQGGTNAAYWRLTGAQNPKPVDAAAVWDQETLNYRMTVEVVLRLEPTAHPNIATPIRSSIGIRNQNNQNYVTPAVAGGDGDAALIIQVARTNGTTWTEMNIGQLARAPFTSEFGGTFDAAASGTDVAVGTINSTSPMAIAGAGGVNTDLSAMGQAVGFPFRCFVRYKTTSGDPTKLRVRMRVQVGGATFYTGAWLPTLTPNGTFTLVDLGVSDHGRRLADLSVGNASSILAIYVEWYTTDASSVGVAADYMEVLFFKSFLKITGLDVQNSDAVVFEDVLKVGSIQHPRRRAIVYQTRLGTYHLTPKIYGQLDRLPAGTSTPFWVAMRNGTNGAHSLTDTANVTIDHLAAYSMGMRGGG